MEKIEMVDLRGQYKKIKDKIDKALIDCVESGEFINGKAVSSFSESLAKFKEVKYVIPCANGTDALQIALMALDLNPGDEIIVPAFTYVATAEVIALLNLVPILVDVMPDDFSINVESVKKLITPKTKAIVPVHLFGQCIDMEELLKVANDYDLYIIEDTAQAIGSEYTFSDGRKCKAGTMGHIGTTSFFPSKNLGCYGDGGAIFTNDDVLASKIRMIANHGQSQKYHHDLVGVNSRLDTIQATILNVKLQYLNDYNHARNVVADFYDKSLVDVNGIIIPVRNNNSTHVFHQYTIKVENGRRNILKDFLSKRGIPTMIYYPLPLHLQKAYKSESFPQGSLPISEKLCSEVLSLPMHTEMKTEIQKFIIDSIKDFFKE